MQHNGNADEVSEIMDYVLNNSPLDQTTEDFILDTLEDLANNDVNSFLEAYLDANFDSWTEVNQDPEDEDDYLYFNSVNDLENLLDDMVDNIEITILESETITENQHNYRLDAVKITIKNSPWPEASVVVKTKIDVPTNTSETLDLSDIINVDADFEGNTTIWGWTQDGSTNPMDNDGPTVIYNNSTTIKITISGVMSANFGFIDGLLAAKKILVLIFIMI